MFVFLLGSPGKLKHNLNINVNALIPGAAPPKLVKSQSLDDKTYKEESTVEPSTSTEDVKVEDRRIPSKENSSSVAPVNLGEAPEKVETLPSMTKVNKNCVDVKT